MIISTAALTVGGAHHSPGFYLPQTYSFRCPAFKALRSKLTLDRRTSSAYFDSFRFAGLILWPAMSACYRPLQVCPKISGIANSNAQVTVSQNGRILYQTRASPALSLPT
ncbi:fimbria/pilus outer membrane usher protein [Salmonella enterica subsp. enterica]|nr:fimbria/pilus outer membrane usher protein [Salmonella enterica subsp. enterica]